MNLNDLFESYTFNQLDKDKAYVLFKDSYEKETGQAWSQGKFDSRARAWTFYGDPQSGFIAVRKQQSGMKKLVGVAGSPKGILLGLKELEEEGGPIWGAVSAPLAVMAKKRGMIVPHLILGGPTFIKMLVKMIPSSVFGGYTPKVTDEGGIVIDYEDIGPQVKYLVGNREYFMSTLKMPEIAEKLKSIPGVKMILRLMGLGDVTIPE